MNSPPLEETNPEQDCSVGNRATFGPDFRPIITTSGPSPKAVDFELGMLTITSGIESIPGRVVSVAGLIPE